jgi:hypothetical protein
MAVPGMPVIIMIMSHRRSGWHPPPDRLRRRPRGPGPGPVWPGPVTVTVPGPGPRRRPGPTVSDRVKVRVSESLGDSDGLEARRNLNLSLLALRKPPVPRNRLSESFPAATGPAAGGPGPAADRLVACRPPSQCGPPHPGPWDGTHGTWRIGEPSCDGEDPRKLEASTPSSYY